MKKMIIIALFLFSTILFAQVGIGTTVPNASSALETSSTNSGLLIPRMSMIQRDLIALPSTGLLIFQTDNTPGFYYYNGTAWVAFGAANMVLAFSQLPIPALAGVITGAASDFTFNKTVNGIVYTITRRTQGQDVGATDVTQRLKLRYTISPALPFVPTAKALTVNQLNTAINDGVTISCKKLTTTVLIVDVYRIDKIGTVDIPWATTTQSFDAVFYE